MHAIIKTGGKQYLVQEGERIKVESLPHKVGDSCTLENVLLLSVEGDLRLGTPVLEGVKVTAKVERNALFPKIIVFKKKRRKGYKKRQGHRQAYTELLIEKIEF